MAQRVRSMMPSPGTGGQQRGTGDVPQPGARDRPVRGERGEKDLSPPHLRADARDVAQQRPTDLLRQRVPLDVVALGPTHANDLLLPVQIIQRQTRHFADAKPVSALI